MNKVHNFIELEINNRHLSLALIKGDKICTNCNIIVNLHNEILYISSVNGKYFESHQNIDTYLNCNEIIIKKMLE